MLFLPALAQAQNIVVVIADDMGVESMASYGEQPGVAVTPTIDSLASQGVLFRNAWAYPVCSPFRVSVMTGEQPHQHGVGHAIAPLDPDRAFVLDPLAPNLANILSSAGYRTAAVGKWHMVGDFGEYLQVLPEAEAHPQAAGLDYYAGELFGSVDYFDSDLTYTDWNKTTNGVTAPTTTYATTDTADEAIGQLSGTEPFFLWVGFNAPHTPLHEPPSALLADPGIYNFTNARDSFLAMVEAMDSELGRIMAAVDLTDTTVIFVGDNGTDTVVVEPPVMQGQAKATVYEGGVNVPLIIAGQAVPMSAEGQEATGLVQATDLFATILEIAAVAGPPRDDSVSLGPYIANPAIASLRDTVFTESFRPNGGPIDPVRHDRAAREVRYKLIRNAASQDEIYDLDVDPFEQAPLPRTNLSPEEEAAYLKLRQVLLANAPPSQVPTLTAPALSVLAGVLAVCGLAAAWGRRRR